MNSSIRDITLRKTIYDLSQQDVANALAEEKGKISRIFAGKLSPSTINQTVLEAFNADFPILDALLPSERQGRTVCNYSAAEAITIAKMAEDALRSAACEADRWLYLRNAAHAQFVAGATYEYDDSKDCGKVLVNGLRLQKAKMHFEALLKLRCIPTQFRRTLEQGVRLNILATAMLTEKADGLISQSSPALAGYNALFDDVLADLKSGCGQKKPEAGEFSRQQIILRTILLYSGSSLTELLLESKQIARAEHVVEKLIEYFGQDHRRSISVFLVNMAWRHNHALYNELFKSVGEGCAAA